MPITNATMAHYPFLKEMYQDAYYPDALVKKGEAILIDLCVAIEMTKPASLADLYALTHAATERFNDLQAEFDDQGSEIETVARDIIGEDFGAIADAYGFADADTEKLIATRDW